MQFSENYDFLKDGYSKRLKLAEQIEKAVTLSERNRLKAEYKQKFNGEEYIDTKSLEKRKKHNKELNNNQITLEIIKTVLEHPDDIEKEYVKYFANENSGIDYTTNPNNKKGNPNNKKGRNKQPSIFGPTKFVASKVIEAAKLYLASIPLISQIKGANANQVPFTNTTNSRNPYFYPALKEAGFINGTIVEKRNPYNDSEIVRKGYFMWNSKIINENIFDHYDVAKFDINLDTDTMIKKDLEPWEVDRYNGCSKDQYFIKSTDLFRITGKNKDGTVRLKTKENAIPSNTIVRRADKTAASMELEPKFKQQVLENYMRKFDNFIQCVKDNNVEIVYLDMFMHRNEFQIENNYAIRNLTHKDFSEFYKKIMSLKNVKNLFIQETSCFYNNELIETLAELIKETGFNGNVIVRRNKNYDKSLILHQEIDVERLNTEMLNGGGKQNILNTYSSTGYEYIVCNKDGCKCITENEAREMMGGSYKQNLDFNKKHGLGDKPANPKCPSEMNLINEKYFEKGENKIKNDDPDTYIENEKEDDYGVDDL